MHSGAGNGNPQKSPHFVTISVRQGKIKSFPWANENASSRIRFGVQARSVAICESGQNPGELKMEFRRRYEPPESDDALIVFCEAQFLLLL
jgi:hypothetical protein